MIILFYISCDLGQFQWAGTQQLQIELAILIILFPSEK